MPGIRAVSSNVTPASPRIPGIRVPENPLRHNEEKRLLDKLMRGYDNSVRPVLIASNPVVIRLGITLTQIFDLDEKKQVLTTNVWLDQEWIDEYLSWDPTEFNNLTKIRIPCEKIWRPDIVLYNSADDYTRGYMNSRAMLEPNGNVFWPPPTKLRSTCPVDVTYFPFDDQICNMKLGSWIYDGLQVDVTNRTSEVDLSNYVSNGEWELLEARIVRNVVYYSCCVEPFPDVTITIVIRRKTLYYMYNVVMPCMMMSILTLLVFCLPPESGEKIALGITVLLAFSVFMLAIAEQMPETSESIPLLGIYLTAVMVITSISVVMTVAVLNFHYRGPNRKEVPSWTRRMVLQRFAACSCFTCLPTKRATSSHQDSVLLRDVGYTYPCPENLKFHVDTAPDDLKDAQEFSSNESVTNINLNEYNHNASKRCSRKAVLNNGVQEEIIRVLHYLMMKQEAEDNHTRVVNEWRQLALIIDRCLFWIILVVTVASSLSFLVIVPLYRRL
ncbi:neuronal acetylcholine receptor subunit alpha-10-like [Tachypleus tridentatus]|uniref:neuronal acetylcholine receptor subunit alpha-10-like n=1 Tax=Tachypleus tridentatus TaxID=6853 RepID=UPI003FCFE283